MNFQIKTARVKNICAFILAFIPLIAFPQQVKRCGTFEYWQKMKQQTPSLAMEEERMNREATKWVNEHRNERITNSVITIPVVVHVLYHTDAENISDAQIQSQIDVLNTDYARLNEDTFLTPVPWKAIAANVGVQFCLAAITPDSVPTNGIERKFTDNTSWANYDDMKFASSDGLNVWNRDYYMNIWVGNLGGNFLGVTSSLAIQPQYDGMCISYKAFGRVGNHLDHRYNLGRTVTHEAGHWLGLTHTWGDDFGACTGTDGINDTPNQADNTFGCPLFPVTDVCSPNYPGIMFMDYMDYTDDACMNLFTNDQVLRMHYVLDNNRISIRDNVTSCNGAITVSLPLKLYPNPVDQTLSVHTYFNVPATLVFSLKDIFGREWMHETGTLNHYEVIPFNVTTIPSGVYIVSATANNISITEKVVVVHR